MTTLTFNSPLDASRCFYKNIGISVSEHPTESMTSNLSYNIHGVDNPFTIFGKYVFSNGARVELLDSKDKDVLDARDRFLRYLEEYAEKHEINFTSSDV